ncbi:MAG: hypothetical protein WKF57_03150 [Nakamurella sp.]
MLRTLSVERIKLLSTRSPYWCTVLILLSVWGIALAVSLVENGRDASVASSQFGGRFGMLTFLVMAALAVTTEYRFGTIRNSLLAVPSRTVLLVSKTVVMALIGAVVAAVASGGGFLLTQALAKAPRDGAITLDSDGAVRMVFGYCALYAIGAVLAVGIGTLLRQSAGAITLLLLWPLLAEQLVLLISPLRDLVPWLPFNAAFTFVNGGESGGGMFGGLSDTGGPTPVQGLLVFAGTALVIWLLALVILQRRDA